VNIRNDFVFEHEYLGNAKGRGAIQNIYMGWFTSFPDVELLTEHLVIDGNRTVQFAKMAGIHKGDFCGLAPSGKRFEIRIAFLFFFAHDQIVREIQQALLPSPNKDLAYVRARSQNIPCHEVGGDYFDYFDLEGGRLGFAIGDVAGKGISAALLAALIEGILSAQTLFDIPLPAMISNVNRNLVQRGTGNRFVTFLFGILDPEGNCTYVNAGHNPPLLVNRDGSITELTAGGMVLGLFAGTQYQAGAIRLKPEDHLVLFTDGVVEALNKAGDEFGIERLTALLRANARAAAGEIRDWMREAVITFSTDAPQHDDFTMMVLGFRESR
jgi:sigma-B regulation protein RsbU (phosphoserine phosphatase)